MNLVIFVKGWLLVRLPNKIIAISAYSAKEANRLYQRQCKFIYLGNLSDSLKGYLPTKKGPKDVINLLTVSRITPYKQFDLIIETVKRIKLKNYQINLIIAGSSPQKRYLENLYKIKTDQTKILFNCSDKNLANLYQNCDVYLSADKYLFFGMPILEAASFGKPAITLNYGAASEIITQGKTGFVADNQLQFKNYLEKIIKNPKLRLKMGADAKKLANNFTWEKTAEKYSIIYQKLLSESQKNNFFFPLVGIVILGIFLRLIFIDKHSFWFDEAISYFISKRPIWSLLKATAADNNPPFYYLLLKIWMSISEKVSYLRFLSTIFGIVSIPLLYSLAKQLVNKKTAFFATVILAISPLHIYFSTETRTYSLLVFETLLSYWLFLKFQQVGSKFYLVLITVVEIISLYTHYYFFFTFLSLNLLFLIHFGRKSVQFRQWMFFQILSLSSLIPWIILVLRAPNPNCWCFYSWIGLPAMLAAFVIGGVGVVTLKEFVFRGPQLPLMIFGLTSILFLFFFFLGIIRSKSRFYHYTLFFFPLGLLSIIGLFKSEFSPRSTIIFSPFYFILVAQGLTSLSDIRRKFWSYVIFISLIWVLIIQYFVNFYHGPPLEEGSRLVSQNHQTNEVIVHSSPMTFYSFQYFHKFTNPEFLAIPSDTAYYTISEIGGYDKPINKIVYGYKNVWFVNIPTWVTPKQVGEIQTFLNKDYLLDRQVHYNNLEIYHYHHR